MPLKVAEYIRSIAPYVPGKPLEELEREYGITDSIKLASNENPLGSSPRVVDAIRAQLGELSRYPDGGAFSLRIRLAALHDVDLDIYAHEFIVLLGPSGSGKSTLAFDILFAEGQRRYLESLAPYVRQYMKILERPDVDLVSGLAPTVAIEQRVSHASRRSTVATLTEIYHFLRLLFSKLGVPHCTGCHRPLTAQSEKDILNQLNTRYPKGAGWILAPKIAGRKGFHKDVFKLALKRGYKRARVDGKLVDLEPDMALSRYHEHTIELVIGSLSAGDRRDLVTRALKEGDGSLIVLAWRAGGESARLAADVAARTATLSWTENGQQHSTADLLAMPEVPAPG